ncbi:hypothetical protein FQZ97_1181990 [compost metagenome]
MPSDTIPCDAAMVSRNVSHLGMKAPAAISRTQKTKPRTATPRPVRNKPRGRCRRSADAVACMDAGPEASSV